MKAVTKTEEIKSTAMTSSFVSIHVTKNKRDFLFLLPGGTSYQDCHEALVEGAHKIKELAEVAINIQKEKDKPEEKQVAEVKEETKEEVK